MKTIIINTPPKMDSNNVTWRNDKGAVIGSGYQGKKPDSLICIMKCPKCLRENYAPVVSSGKCAFCDFNPNKKEKND
jgi:hypothetical protein